MFARCWFIAARAALVILSTNCCVVGGEKSLFRIVGARDACDPNAGACVGSEHGGGSRCTVLFRAIRGGNGGPEPSGRVRGKNAVLASNIVSRGRSHAEFLSLSRFPKLRPS